MLIEIEDVETPAGEVSHGRPRRRTHLGGFRTALGKRTSSTEINLQF